MISAGKVFLLALLPGFLPVDAPPFPEETPAVLRVEYDRPGWGAATVVWKDGRLLCSTAASAGESVAATRPTLAQWILFVHALNAAKVYCWNSHYRGPEANGDAAFHWAIDLRFGDVALHSDGEGAYPPDGDLFMRAVGRLAGRNFPGDD